MKIGAVIQARKASRRLANKILKKLPYGSGITVLGQVIRRLKLSKKLNSIIIATTLEKEDIEIVKIAKNEAVKFFRGSTEDVLSRSYLAAKENNLDIIVRITSDCPCIDPEIVDLVIEKHLQTKADYTSNRLERRYPVGFDTEVINFHILENAYENAKDDYDREHVTPYICKKPDKFTIAQVKSPPELYAPDVRITIDTEEDYVLLCAIFDYLYPKNQCFTYYDIMNLLKEKPWLKLIIKKVVAKNAFESLEDELKEVIKIADLQDLKRAGKFIRKHLLNG